MPRFSLALPGRKFTVAYACVCFRANFCNRREIFKRNFSIKGAKSGVPMDEDVDEDVTLKLIFSITRLISISRLRSFGTKFTMKRQRREPITVFANLRISTYPARSGEFLAKENIRGWKKHEPVS